MDGRDHGSERRDRDVQARWRPPLSLYPRADLAKDAAIALAEPQSGEFSLAQLVRSRDDVDALLEKAASAGAAVTPARDRPWGIYSGYFRDLDGHLWEVIWHPTELSRAS
jgi:uncharacterized glyoxalase superfamily protein PhnB